jgi:ribonuclease HIII
MQNTYSTEIKRDVFEKYRELFRSNGFEEIPPKSPYQEWIMKSQSATITLYSSGKMVIQGRDISSVKTLMFGDTDFDSKFTPHIGADETGKGDYFGAMVCASVYVDDELRLFLEDLGVMDSKKIRDNKIVEMAAKIRPIAKYHIDIVSPLDYNNEYKKVGNVAVILSRSHSRCFEALLDSLAGDGIDCKKIVIDQFSQRKDRILNELGPLAKQKEVEQFHKAESDIAVAAASILARDRFIELSAEMCDKWGVDFPKGATDVINTGKHFVDAYGVDKLQEVAKLSFRTTEQVLDRNQIDLF